VIDGSAQALPLTDAACDTVYSFFSIKHWPDRAAGLAECLRVLRPDGLLVIAELDRAADLAQWRSFIDLTALPRPLKPVYAAATIKPFVRAGPLR